MVALREIRQYYAKLLGKTRCTCIMEDMQMANSCLCANPEHLNFWKILVKFPFFVGSLDGQVPHQLAFQKASPTSHASSHQIDRRLTCKWISLQFMAISSLCEVNYNFINWSFAFSKVWLPTWITVMQFYMDYLKFSWTTYSYFRIEQHAS